MDEPRKPFKTISLVDRLAASTYNADPALSGNADKKGVDLKKVSNLQTKTGQTLKNLLVSRSEQSLPILKRTQSLLSTQLDIPSAQTKFGSSISLRDRLDQTTVTGTKHLPQYFLSDLYTGYLAIQPLDTPSIALQSVGVLKTITIGGVVEGQTDSISITPILSASKVLVSQGTIDTIGFFDSITQIKRPLNNEETLITQGTFLTLGRYFSFTNLTAPKSVTQGTVTIQAYNTNPNQGPGITPNGGPSVGEIAVLQGLIVRDGLLRGSVISLAEPVAGIALVNSPIPSLAKPATQISLVDSPIPSLNILGYEADRALTFLAPQIKHGSTTVRPFETDPNKNPPKEFTSPAVGPPQDDPNRNPPKEFTSPAVSENPPPSLLGLDDLDTIERAVGDGVVFPGSNQGSLSSYKALSYGEIVSKARGPRRRASGPVVRIEQTAETKKIQDQPGTEFKDFIDIIIEGSGKTVKLKAYLDNYSDSFTAEWNKTKYVGRQDDFYNFTGASRAVSFSVKVPAFSKADLKPNFEKIETVIGMTQIASFNGNYLQGPLCKLTLGKLFVKTNCVFNSLKIDFDPKETPMDIDEQLPQLVTLSFDVSILTANNDQLLNASTNKYFGGL